MTGVDKIIAESVSFLLILLNDWLYIACYCFYDSCRISLPKTIRQMLFLACKA